MLRSMSPGTLVCKRKANSYCLIRAAISGSPDASNCCWFRAPTVSSILRRVVRSGFGGSIAAVAAAAVFSGVMSFILLKLVGLVFPLRADDESQSIGLDVAMHGEEAYVHSGGSEAMIG